MAGNIAHIPEYWDMLGYFRIYGTRIYHGYITFWGKGCLAPIRTETEFPFVTIDIELKYLNPPASTIFSNTYLGRTSMTFACMIRSRANCGHFLHLSLYTRIYKYIYILYICIDTSLFDTMNIRLILLR